VNVRLVSKLAMQHVMVKCHVNISLKYETGKVFNEEVAGTSKSSAATACLYRSIEILCTTDEQLLMYDKRRRPSKTMAFTADIQKRRRCMIITKENLRDNLDYGMVSWNWGG